MYGWMNVEACPHCWIDFMVCSSFKCVYIFIVCVCAGACCHYSEYLSMLIQMKCWKFMAADAKPFGQQQNEILSCSTDVCNKTESLTEVVLDHVEETMRILDKIYGYTAHAPKARPPTCLLPSCSPLFGCCTESEIRLYKVLSLFPNPTVSRHGDTVP